MQWSLSILIYCFDINAEKFGSTVEWGVSIDDDELFRKANINISYFGKSTFISKPFVFVSNATILINQNLVLMKHIGNPEIVMNIGGVLQRSLSSMTWNHHINPMSFAILNQVLDNFQVSINACVM